MLQNHHLVQLPPSGRPFAHGTASIFSICHNEQHHHHHPADSEAENKTEEEDIGADHASLATRRDSADRGGEEERLSAAAAAVAAAGAHVPVDGTIGGETSGSGSTGGGTVGSGGMGDEEEGRVVAGGAMCGEGASARPQLGQVVRACELNPSCSICLFEYFLDEDVTLLPCGHLYHKEVIFDSFLGLWVLVGWDAVWEDECTRGGV